MNTFAVIEQILRRPWPLWSPIITVVLYVLLGIVAILYAGEDDDAILPALQVGFVIPLGIFMWSSPMTKQTFLVAASRRLASLSYVVWTRSSDGA
jgi:hypothetical protein